MIKNDPSADKLVAVTPNDSADLTLPNGFVGTTYLYVGVSGDVAVVTAAGDSVTLKSVAAGYFHPVSVRKVLATGTTATDILAAF